MNIKEIKTELVKLYIKHGVDPYFYTKFTDDLLSLFNIKEKLSFEETIEIYEKAKKIVASDLTWSEKFDLIFSDEISNKFDFERTWSDYDYEDDIRTYMQDFDKYIEKCKMIKEQIGEI